MGRAAPRLESQGDFRWPPDVRGKVNAGTNRGACEVAAAMTAAAGVSAGVDCLSRAAHEAKTGTQSPPAVQGGTKRSTPLRGSCRF